jgi:hypothetical protein
MPFLNLLGAGFYPEESVIQNAQAYIPELEVYNRPIVDRRVAPETGMRIRFKLVQFVSFEMGHHEYTVGYYPNSFLNKYMMGFNYPNWTVDSVLAFLSNFELEHGHCAMARPSSYEKSLAGVCYEVLTKRCSPKVKEHQQQPSQVRGIYQFIDTLRYLVQNNKISAPEDSVVFSLFLAKCGGYNQDLVNYFHAPLDNVTATEALAYKSSIFASFMPDRFAPIRGLKPAMEASTPADEDVGDDTPADTFDSETPDDEGDGAMGPDPAMSGTDALGATMEEETPRQRQRTRLLLELAKPDEKLSDYLYRKIVATRMIDVISDPPKYIPSLELLIMKRYVSLWINIVSVASIKDFLSRLSFQLMESALPSGEAQLS